MSFLRRRSGVRTPRQRAGDAAEQAACDRLVASGCRILARNVRYREGELDIVAQDGAVVVFVEVRLRNDARFGGAAGSVDHFKRRRLVRAAQHYLVENFSGHHSAAPARRGAVLPPCRFDVITADAAGVGEWIRDAFSEQ
jgi:putative endonuclease